MYVAFDEYGAAPTSMLYRLTLDGEQDWAAPVPTSNDVFMQRQACPRSARTEPCISPA